MLTLPAAITHNEAVDVLRRFEQAIAQTPPGGEIVVDGSALERIDSTTIALLLACRRQVKDGRRLVLQGLPAELTTLASLYGVDALLCGPATPTAT